MLARHSLANPLVLLLCTIVQVQVRSQLCDAKTLLPLHLNYSALGFVKRLSLTPEDAIKSTSSPKQLSLRSDQTCHTRSSDDCHDPIDNFEYECIWCENWCLHKNKTSKTQTCPPSPEELEDASVPVIDSVMPKFILEGIPTLMTIEGLNLHTNSTKIGINITIFQITYMNDVCRVISENLTRIQCILDGVEPNKPTKKDALNVTIKRELTVYGETRARYFSLTNIVIPLRNSDYDGGLNAPDEPVSEPSWLESIGTYLFVGLGIGVLGCTVFFMIFIKRQHVRQVYEKVERMIMVKKMRRQLIEKNLYVEYDKIQLKTKLGDGNFGEVYLAQVTQHNVSFEVAIKKLKKGSDMAKTRMFLTEGIRMSAFKHERILSPVSIMIDNVGQAPAIVLPIMVNGDLCRYLRKNKVFPIVKLLTFALQIAEGMEYLSSINVVHGDLAARNCLLDEKLEIKVGDFGMSRQMYRTDYVTINDIYRPMRWMALECLTSKKPRFTIKSDVWSFGVVLWEIFTLGSYPYEEFDNWDLHKHLEGGYRLHKPLNCPQVIYAFMSKCWSVDATERPSFADIRHQLTATLEVIEFEQNQSKQTELAHSSLRDQLAYTTLAECFIQNRSNSDGSVAFSIASSNFSQL